MKPFTVVLAILAFAASLAGAQEAAIKATLVKRFALTERQAEQFVAVYTDSALELAKARAEVNVQKALLAKLLLDVDANQREVEKVLRQAVESEVQVRMIQIRRELAARKLIGDRRWIQLRELVQRLSALKVRQAARDAPNRAAVNEEAIDEKDQAVLQQLLELLGE